MTDTQAMYAILGSLGILWLIILVTAVFLITCEWKIFKKAGYDGWKAIIPFYNEYTLCEFTFGNGLWFLGYFVSIIPIVGYIALGLFTIVANIRLAKSFGQSTGFVVGLIFLPIVFIPILAFGDATYTKLPDYDIHHPFD